MLVLVDRFEIVPWTSAYRPSLETCPYISLNKPLEILANSFLSYWEAHVANKFGCHDNNTLL